MLPGLISVIFLSEMILYFLCYLLFIYPSFVLTRCFGVNSFVFYWGLLWCVTRVLWWCWWGFRCLLRWYEYFFFFFSDAVVTLLRMMFVMMCCEYSHRCCNDGGVVAGCYAALGIFSHMLFGGFVGIVSIVSSSLVVKMCYQFSHRCCFVLLMVS